MQVINNNKCVSKEGKIVIKPNFNSEFLRNFYYFSAPSTPLNGCITIFIKNTCDWAVEMHFAKYHAFWRKFTLINLSTGQFRVITTLFFLCLGTKKAVSPWADKRNAIFPSQQLSSTSLLRLSPSGDKKQTTNIK